MKIYKKSFFYFFILLKFEEKNKLFTRLCENYLIENCNRHFLGREECWL